MSLSNEPSGESGQVDEWSRHLWHTSQHGRMVISLGGRLQDLANEMRKSVGLPEFGWNDAFPDEMFGECSVHVDGCEGQHTHEAEHSTGDTSRSTP